MAVAKAISEELGNNMPQGEYKPLVEELAAEYFEEETSLCLRIQQRSVLGGEVALGCGWQVLG